MSSLVHAQDDAVVEHADAARRLRQDDLALELAACTFAKSASDADVDADDVAGDRPLGRRRVRARVADDGLRLWAEMMCAEKRSTCQPCPNAKRS